MYILDKIKNYKNVKITIYYIDSDIIEWKIIYVENNEVMNLEHIANTIDYTPSRDEWINDAEAISRQISANLIMILCEKYFQGIKWNTKRNQKLLYNLFEKIINQGGGRDRFNARWAAFFDAFHRRETETRHWIEKEKKTWCEKEEGMSVEVLDKFYWDYRGALTSFSLGIEHRDIKWITYGLKKISNYDKQDII